MFETASVKGQRAIDVKSSENEERKQRWDNVIHNELWNMFYFQKAKHIR